MDIVSYMDVDLCSGLDAFPLLVTAIAEEAYGVAIGSRHVHGARDRRSLTRRSLSLGYNLLVKLMFRTRFSDARCGFKAASREVARRVVPLIEDNGPFFDTELLILAEKLGYRVKDVPVIWAEDPDTRVKIDATIAEDVLGLIQLRLSQPWRKAPHAKRG